MLSEKQLLENHLNSLESPQTKMVYDGLLKDYMDFHGFKRAGQLLGNIQKIQDQIIKYITFRKEKGIRRKSISVMLSALWHFYTYNDVIGINWHKVRRFLPAKQNVMDRAYSTEDIRKMLLKCDERKRVTLLLLCATGIRVGALPLLKLKHLKRLDHIYKLTIYDGDYYTYCTPECGAAIDQYLEYRTRRGETLKPDSPLIREQFKPAGANNPRPIGKITYQVMIYNLAIDAGLRVKGRDRAERKDTMLVHGFRKFYNTKLESAGVRPLIKEMLMGHLTGLEASYLRPSEDDVLKEYLKAVDSLTIFTENKLAMEIQELRSKLNVDAKVNQEISTLRATLAATNGQIKALLEDQREMRELLKHPDKLLAINKES